MKIQLFDDDDLKRFEDAIAKALVRALRTVMREGAIAGYKPPAAEAFTASQPEPPPPAAPAPASEPDRPLPVFGRHMGEPQSGHTYTQEYKARNGVTHPIVAALRQPEPEPEQESRRWTAKDVCESTTTKPPGYITTDEAAKLIGLSLESAKSTLSQWLRARAIKGIILCNSGMTPTKGLPGRLFVEKASVLAREQIRQQNSAAMKERGAGRFAQAAE